MQFPTARDKGSQVKDMADHGQSMGWFTKSQMLLQLDIVGTFTQGHDCGKNSCFSYSIKNLVYDIY